ncbi:hypothetical protein Ancab_024909 [Ancistrocladus abbreviatus]
MEESQEILLNSLKSFGISIPSEVSSIGELNSAAFFSICSQSLHFLDVTSSFPTSLPDSMADKVKISTEIAVAMKNLGYIGDISFHKFMYPSEEDLYKLVRFLVERLSEAGNAADVRDFHTGAKASEHSDKSASNSWMEKDVYDGINLNYQNIQTRFRDLSLESDLPESSSNKAEATFSQHPLEANLGSETSSSMLFMNKELASIDSSEELAEDSGELRKTSSHNAETAEQRGVKHVLQHEQKLTSHQELECKAENIDGQEKVLLEGASATSLELQHLEAEHEILKEAAKMAFDDHYPVDYYIEQLNEKVEAGRCSLQELEDHWDTILKPLEDKKRKLMESLCLTKPEAKAKLEKLNEIELEMQSLLSEIRKREEECILLSADLKNQPKVAPRRSYILKITEITKNSRKQDADIERILKDTRELRLESNSTGERLHRTYAVVDDTVYREAKKDSIGRQAYRLLTSIHDCFEQIREKILETDRTRREAADLEAKLAAMSSRNLDIDKLQADLDAIRRENEYLEQSLQNN